VSYRVPWTWIFRAIPCPTCRAKIEFPCQKRWGTVTLPSSPCRLRRAHFWFKLGFLVTLTLAWLAFVFAHFALHLPCC
jgi:hypothetical protein